MKKTFEKFLSATAENTVASLHFLVRKFCEKTQFQVNRPKVCGNCAPPQNFQARKLSETMVFYAVTVHWLHALKNEIQSTGDKGQLTDEFLASQRCI